MLQISERTHSNYIWQRDKYSCKNTETLSITLNFIHYRYPYIPPTPDSGPRRDHSGRLHPVMIFLDFHLRYVHQVRSHKPSRRR